MKDKYKNNSVLNSDNSSSPSGDIRDFEIFKSRVANAVLDYMETQNDLELWDCLEKASGFLANVSNQMENVFDNERQALKDKNDLIEISDDLFPIGEQNSSSTIH